jgi:thiamine biosynthesis lipoprotein
VSIAAGAVASSTPLKRRWGSGADESHHLIDPASGRPREHPHRSVTAVAAEAWWAEVATKDLLGRPAGAEPLPGVAALVVDAEGDTHLIGGMEGYL